MGPRVTLPLRLRSDDTMEVQNRRRNLRLSEHVVNLAAVMGLVVKEVRDQQLDRVLQGSALVVHIADRPL